MKEYNNLTALESQQGGCRKVCDLISKCGSSVACDAFHAPRSSQLSPLQLHAFEANPVDDSDLYTWDLRLYDFERDQPIAADLRERELDHVALRIIFPQASALCFCPLSI